MVLWPWWPTHSRRLAVFWYRASLRFASVWGGVLELIDRHRRRVSKNESHLIGGLWQFVCLELNQ